MTNQIVHEIDGISFMLKEKHAFDWLMPLGTVFCVFDWAEDLSLNLVGLGKRQCAMTQQQIRNNAGNPV
ncbi:hypothetical protein [Paenibacillus sp. TSA_86.1]|uniref:hypothetical protein n=1 Tax=Paenibacillus sp. TSA_86.1 TaxID=3415649 RepID=UPI00404656A7